MKILLVSHSFDKTSRSEFTPNEPYSLGLAYIASYLEEKGHEVFVLCLNNYSFFYSHGLITAKIKEFNPDILGIQIFTMNRVSSFKLIEYCSERFPHLRLILGGIHVSAMFDQIIKKYKNTIAVIGEGELTCSELLMAFEKNNSLETVKGVAFWKDGKVLKTEKRELVSNLDLFPHPKHEVFFNSESKRTMAHIITSRGCPFKCSFCCLHIISERKFRTRSVNDVVMEIENLKKKHPELKTIQIHDDNFTLNNERVIDFCKKIISKKLDVSFIASGKIKPVSEDMLLYMEKAGFKKLMFGLETGSEKLMKSIHKEISQEDVVDLFFKLKKTNFVVTTFLMVGFPGENENTVKETISFVKKLQKIKYSYISGVGKLWAYPGTEVYEIMLKKNLISDNYWLTDKDAPYFTAEHNEETLINFEKIMLSHLSIQKIFTLKGFFNQFLSMPTVIIKFIVHSSLHNKGLLLSLIAEIIKSKSPAAYRLTYNTYKKLR